MADLKLNKVVKRFGEVQTIHGVDLDIKHGEFVVFVGPSGCGKSTLLRMIAGLETISDGEVVMDESARPRPKMRPPETATRRGPKIS